jgi:hypothetical protein
VPSLETLRNGEVVGVLQQLLTEYDDHPEPAVTDEEIAERSREDEDFVRALAAELGLEEPGSEPPPPGDLLTSLAALPEISGKAERAAEDVRSCATLPFDQQLLSTLISVAAAVAILGPKIEYRKTGLAREHHGPARSQLSTLGLCAMRLGGHACRGFKPVHAAACPGPMASRRNDERCGSRVSVQVRKPLALAQRGGE